MHVIIVGAGLVGTALARHLTMARNEVSIIEANEERARHASNYLDCMVIHDEGNSLSVLMQAGLDKASSLVSVTGSDEINIIICGIAESRNPSILKIARVRNEDYVRFIREYAFHGIDYFVHPNVEASRSALAAIEHNAAGDVLSFAGTEYELGSIEIALNSAFDGLLLKNYRNVVPGETLITLLERQGKCILPSGSTSLAAGDRVHILAAIDEMDKLFELGGQKAASIRKIGVVGGGQAGSLIVEGLLGHNKNAGEAKKSTFFSFVKGFILKRNRKVIIIEQDYNICKELSARFPEAVVINEDISDENLVLEERLGGLDLIVTATGNQELNIITALYLKSAGVRRAIAIVAQDGYAAIARRLGVDVVIPIKSVMVDSILSRLSGGGMRSIHRLGDGSIAVFEIEIPANAPAVECPVSEWRPPSGGLVMLVQRGEESFIPHGEYVFKAGDRIIISAKKGGEKEIEKFFGIGISK